MNPCKPTLSGFQDFVTNVMQIPEEALAVGSPYIQMAFELSMQTVLCQIRGISPLLYQQAVYNLAASLLIQYTPDNPCMTYFSAYRKNNNIGGSRQGVISASSDETTSQSWLIPDFYKNLSISDFQNMSNPYGIAYLAIAQKYGAIWGLN